MGRPVSLAKAWQSDQWNSRYLARAGKLIYSKDDIEKALGEITSENSKWDRYFARNQITPLKVVYEDLVINHEQVLRMIARLAGVTLNDIPLLEDSGLKVQRDALTQDWRDEFSQDTRGLERIY